MVDFFNPPDAQCVNTSERRMYLYDGGGTTPAVLLATPTDERPVIVENKSGLSYVFRPVDKVIYESSDPKRGDVFFHTVDRLQLVFAELKLWHVPGWFKAGVEQLRCVVLDFIAAHSAVFEASRIRRAYVCNPYHPRFAFSYAAEIRDFRRETRFVLHPVGLITIS